MIVAVDTREQTPWVFPADVTTELATLRSGDYSVRGFESRIAIERKSLDDLVGSITSGRERFVRELTRLASFDFRCVIVEANIDDIWAHRYVSRAVPSSVIGSCAAFAIDFNIPFLFGGDAAKSADFGLRLLRRWHANTVEQTADQVSA